MARVGRTPKLISQTQPLLKYNSSRQQHHLVFIAITGKGKVRVKCTLVQAPRLCTGRTAHRGVEVQLCSFLTTALEGGEGSASRPGRSLPPGKTRYPLYRRLGGPLGRSGKVRKISPPPAFDPRTVYPVASRYTDYAIQFHPYCQVKQPFGYGISRKLIRQ